MNILRLVLFLGLALMLSACGVTKKGADFSVNEDTRFVEDGVASWYGPNFHGKLTANGEVYDMNGVTAAHRTMPFGTILLVENQDNGKTVQVRVNDRGPYAKNRIIDLSKGAAERINMIGPGTANVKLYLLEGDLENSRITDLKVPNYTVQLGSYRQKSDAEKQSQKIDGSRVVTINNNEGTFYRVYYGRYTEVDNARSQMQRLQQAGYAGFVKQIEND